MKRIQYNSPVVLSFSLISLLALLADFITGGAANRLLFSVYRSPLSDIGGYFRLFFHVLGHGNLQHYMNNMLLFLLVGPGLEEKYGSKRLLQAIVLTAAVTGLVHCLLFPHHALLGASGVVFMLIILSSFTGDKHAIPLTLILVTVLYLGQELVSGLLAQDNISQLTHILGGAVGMACGFVWRKQSRR